MEATSAHLTEREKKLVQLKEFVELCDAHEVIQIPDTLVFPLQIGLVKPVVPRRRRQEKITSATEKRAK